MTLYTDSRLTALGVRHGTTDRSLGNMRLSASTTHLFHSQQISQSNILRFKQIHSDKIIEVLSTEQFLAIQQATLPEADAWILAPNGWGAAILTADCTPLIVWDEPGRLLGLAHCGWRGVAAALPAKIARRMRQLGAQGTLSAWIGPHIQSCCFEVQEDVAQLFPHATQRRGSKLFVDLNQEIGRQLNAADISCFQAVYAPACTCCQPNHFFSFRRDHTKDAMLTFVYRPAEKTY